MDSEYIDVFEKEEWHAWPINYRLLRKMNGTVSEREAPIVVARKAACEKLGTSNLELSFYKPVVSYL